MKKFAGDITRLKSAGPPEIIKGNLWPPEFATFKYDRFYEGAMEKLKAKTARGESLVKQSLGSSIQHHKIPAINTLEGITLQEVVEKVNMIHSGKVMFASIVRPPVHTVGVSLLIEDIDCNRMMLSVDNFLKEGEKAEDVFTVGTHIAVLEPYMKYSRDDPKNGALMLRCDHPCGIILYATKREWLQARGILPSESPTTLSIEALKKKGNDAFARADFKKAEEMYTHAISECKLYPTSDGSGSQPTTGVDSTLLVTILSNRAQCHFLLENYEMCITDSQQALSLNPDHHKSKYRLGKGYLYSQQPEKTLSLFGGSAAERSADIGVLVRDAKRAMNEKNGVYDLLALKNEVTKSKGFVNGSHADYVHPSLQIGPVPGKGRGITTLTFLPKDTIIVACKAFEYCHQDPENSEIVARKPVESYYRSPLPQTLLTKVAAKVYHVSPARRGCFFDLADGRTSTDIDFSVPLIAKMAGGAGSGIQEVADENIDMERAKNICAYNQFAAMDSSITSTLEKVRWQSTLTKQPTQSDLEKFESKERNGSGMWLLPSYFNHSCCPNVTHDTYGDFMVMRTATDVEPNVELCISYVAINMSHEERAYSLNQWKSGAGFTCVCSRCGYDEANPEFSKLESLFLARYREGVELMGCGGLSTNEAMERALSSEMRNLVGSCLASAPTTNRIMLFFLHDLELAAHRDTGRYTQALQTAEKQLGLLRGGVTVGQLLVVQTYLIMVGLKYHTDDHTGAENLLRCAYTAAYPWATTRSELRMLCEVYSITLPPDAIPMEKILIKSFLHELVCRVVTE